jgi:hypothetical protein
MHGSIFDMWDCGGPLLCVNTGPTTAWTISRVAVKVIRMIWTIIPVTDDGFSPEGQTNYFSFSKKVDCNG